MVAKGTEEIKKNRKPHVDFPFLNAFQIKIDQEIA
jgi:hypothetical protein